MSKVSPRGVLLLITWLFATFCSHADDDIEYHFQPVDSITRMDLQNPEVLVFLPGDSTLVCEGHKMTIGIAGELISRQYQAVKLPNKEAEYNVFIDAEGYNTRVFKLKTKKEKTYSFHDLGEIGVLRAPRKLDEVTVSATKIRLYYKGDTLIYNADAFALPHGSMLDDLIRKLDGVTINDSGEIFCNGRKVESLQLDGRNLFDGNPKTLLENLGAYTVSKIKVYDYTSDRSKFLGYSDKEEKPLVMDVNLKKQYSLGKWVDVDAGYGTSDRYLGRAFLMAFTKHFALSAFLNGNNLAVDNNPSKYSTQYTMGSGALSDCSYLSGGLSYQYDSRNRKTQITGSLNVNSERENKRTGSRGENFLTTGNTFESNFSNSRSRRFSIGTRHTLNYKGEKVYLTATPSFNFSNGHSESSTASASFNADPGKITEEEIREIYSTDSESRLRSLINRQLRNSESNTGNINGRINASATIKFRDRGENFKHNLTLWTQDYYNKSNERRLNRFDINYGDNPTPATSQTSYTDTRPNHFAYVNASAKYEMNLRDSHTLSATYYYGHDWQRNTNSRYLLSDLHEIEAGTIGLDNIPPADVINPVKDLRNSNATNYWSNDHRIVIRSQFRWGNHLIAEGGKGAVILGINPTLRFFERNYHYTKAGYDTLASRKMTLPQIQSSLIYCIRNKKNLHFWSSLGWNSTPNTFAMNNIINVVDDANPLYIFYGNPNLRNGYTHSSSLEMRLNEVGKFRDYRLNANYGFSQDQIMRGTIYNPLTGVRTSSMYNVNGSRWFSIMANSSGPIKSWESGWAKRLNYDVSISFNHNRSIDMLTAEATDAMARPGKSYVYRISWFPSANIGFDYGGGHSIKLNFSGAFNHYDGTAADYVDFSARQLNYKANLSFRLPKDFQLYTTLAIYSRHGYTADELNTSDFILNAGASWYWRKPKLHFKIDGYDLLQQIKNISYTASATGRSESWSNVIPQYVLLHVTYHIDMSPK